MKELAKYILRLLWSFKRGKITNRIIYYHSVLEEGKRSHRVADFRKQMFWLKSNGYTSILVSSIPEIISGNLKCEEPWVAITFDDGYEDNIKEVLPILQEFGFTATFFIVTSWLDDEKERFHGYSDVPPLSRNGVKKLYTSGMGIGSHTHTHRMCTHLTEEELKQEIILSKEILEDIVGECVTVFSYPNGQKGAFSKRTQEHLASYEFEVVCTTLWGSVTRKSKLLSMPRCEISHMDSLKEFEDKMLGRHDYLYYVHRLLNQSKIWNSKDAKVY